MKLATAPALALALIVGVAACSDQSGVERMLGPTESHEAKSGQSDGDGWKARYTVLTGFTPSSATLAAKSIGAAGGNLEAGSFRLTVPPGAVNRSADFRMEVLSNGTYGVRLTATRTEWNGTVTDVGRQGFKKPLLLALSYASVASSIPEGAALSVVWLKQDRTAVPMAGYVDTEQQAVFGWLKHFSEYGIGWPNFGDCFGC